MVILRHFVPAFGLFFYIFLVGPIASVAQELPIAGTPFVRNYAPEEYGGHNQNWGIVQDARGLMYFANNHGVLEYDGVSWRLIPTTSNSAIRSLAVDRNGRIYVGSIGELGYLRPDTARKLTYVSLLPAIPKAQRDFPDVWQTLSVGKYIYFVTPKYIFRWDGRRMRSWKAQTSFHVGFALNDRFYVRQKEVGLMGITGDSLSLLPAGGQFAGERIMAIMPFPANGKQRMLLATRTNGLMLFDGITTQRFATGADSIFSTGQIYCGTALNGGQFALGTLQNGVVVVDEKGRVRRRLHKETGLLDNTIWYLFQDRQGALWAGMHNGIARAEVASRFTYFDEKEGFEGSALQIVRHAGMLYTASSMGIYYLDEKPGAARAPGRFRKVSGVSPQGWAVLPFDDVLLAGVFDGVYEINGGGGRIIDSCYAMSLYRSRKYPSRVYVGMQSGVKVLVREGGRWRNEGAIAGIDQEIRNIYEMADGKLWLSTYHNGLILADLSGAFTLRPRLTIFDQSGGLPSAERPIPFETRGGLRFATQKGVYRFDEKQKRFLPDTSLIAGLDPEKARLFNVSSDRRGNLWLIQSEKSPSGLAVRDNKGQYHWQEGPLRRIKGINTYFAYPDPQNKHITWLGSIDRVIRYDDSTVNPAPWFPTLIREITVNGDSLLFGGVSAGLPNPWPVHFAYNTLRFRYAAPSFDDPGKTQYQYKLEGFDREWSAWTSETYKDYTQLPPGTYEFLVRAMDLHGVTGQTARFVLRILPPFYLTWWAYVLYALAFAWILYRLMQYQQGRLRKKHAQAVAEMEYDKLFELDQMKSRFFANISHEFRTPLTLIIGPMDKLLSEKQADEHVRQFIMVKRNAQRLLRLINQLLDLSKLEVGKMKLDLQYLDAVPLIRGIVSAFESLSDKADLQFESDLGQAFLYLDRDKFEQALTNILSNAFKFTPLGGRIRVTVGKNANGQNLRIEITDSGPGIPSEHLPHIFDRFYQANDASPTGEPGSGIGLALTKELILLHQGTVTAGKAEGGGARFTILLPFPDEQPATATGEPAHKPSYAPAFTEAAMAHPELFVEIGDTAEQETLLIVEDNADMRSFLRDCFEGRYRLIEAYDGQDGADRAFQHIPDLIISDVMMPRKDGFELCETLKTDERTSHIPVILLTARADMESRIAGLTRGADDYLAKPFQRDELVARVRNLLEGRRRLRERYASLPATTQSETANGQVEDLFIQKIISLVEQHLSEPDFEVEQLSRLAGMSRSQLFRKIKALTGRSPSLFIRSIRLHHARTLLQTTGMNVNEVADAVGFSTPAYFSDAFMETYGIRPSAARKQG